MDPLKLLVVFAHPDDESMGMGGTLAKYSAEGVDTHLVCASRGERGWAGPEEQNPGLSILGQIRTQELENAVKELGMMGLYFLNYADMSEDSAASVLAMQGTFYRAFSLVNGGRTVETDLFEGLR
jgi:LmbE family N-acetylglucosaminyl deacetylase